MCVSYSLVSHLLFSFLVWAQLVELMFLLKKVWWCVYIKIMLLILIDIGCFMIHSR